MTDATPTTTTPPPPPQEIRWRNSSNGRWKSGRLIRINPDGTEEFYDTRIASRTMDLSRVRIERKVKGPRGGTHWRPLLEDRLAPRHPSDQDPGR
jgi:hypothetical protein